MSLTTLTVQPIATSQPGWWNVVGAINASAALSDGSDSSYVQLLGLCRLDSQVLRVLFPTPSLPAGAKVYSVTLRRRVQTVTPSSDVPLCYHWFRSTAGTITVAGQQALPVKSFYNSPCPVTTTSQWTNETIITATTGPDGQPWDVTTNLNGLYYDMGRGDSSTTATLRVSEVYLDITYQQRSSVSVTAPTGTVPDTRPTIKWSYSSPDSQPQQAYMVAVYTAAQVAASGFVPFTTTPIQGTGTWVLGEDLQWTLPSDLTDGSYYAYVQAKSRWAGPGDFTTAVASTSWTRSAASSSPPPAAVLSSAVFDSVNNRVGLTFQPGGSSPVTVAFTVQASRDGGQSWQAIPSLTYIPANGMSAVTAYDYYAPLNVLSQYRLIAYAGSPMVAATSPSNVLSVTPTGNQHWLKNPANPLQNTPLPVAASKDNQGIKVTKRRLMGTFQLLGGAGSKVPPFVVSGPTYGDEYEYELIFIDGDLDTPMTLWSAVDQLDRTGGTLLLQQPNGNQLWVRLGPGASGQETEETFDAVPGDPTTVYWRRRKLVMTEVAAPSYY